MNARVYLLWLTGLSSAIVWLVGCNKLPSLDEAKQAITGGAKDAEQKVQNATESVKQLAGAAGTIELQLDCAGDHWRMLRHAECFQ